MIRARGFVLVRVALALAYIAYVTVPKHAIGIHERIIGGNTKIDSTWTRLQGDDKGPAIDWRAQTNNDPAKPPFVILLRPAPGAWQADKPEAVLVCDSRRIAFRTGRAELVEVETAQASFLVCTGTLDDLAALVSATDLALVIDGHRYSFGASGPTMFRELERRTEARRAEDRQP